MTDFCFYTEITCFYKENVSFSILPAPSFKNNLSFAKWPFWSFRCFSSRRFSHNSTPLVIKLECFQHYAICFDKFNYPNPYCSQSKVGVVGKKLKLGLFFYFLWISVRELFLYLLLTNCSPWLLLRSSDQASRTGPSFFWAGLQHSVADFVFLASFVLARFMDL